VLRNAVVGLAGVERSLVESARGMGMSRPAIGPGLGGFIFTGLSRLGGANALNSALTGTIAVVLLALVLDLLLVAVGRLTTPRGIRV
jgi:osmoprotectant transport system permease protein